MRLLESRTAFLLLPIVIPVVLTAAVLSVSHGFSLEGRLQSRFGGIVMSVPMTPEYDKRSVDISEKVCPLLDEALRKELGETTDVPIGNWFFGGARVLVITQGPNVQCFATVHNWQPVWP